jgi:hypothetical protein
LQSLDIVLPLKVDTPYGGSDLDRFKLLLLPSFDRFFSDNASLRFTLIVPRSDMDWVAGQVSSSTDYEIVLLC